MVDLNFQVSWIFNSHCISSFTLGLELCLFISRQVRTQLFEPLNPHRTDFKIWYLRCKCNVYLQFSLCVKNKSRLLSRSFLFVQVTAHFYVKRVIWHGLNYDVSLAYHIAPLHPLLKLAIDVQDKTHDPSYTCGSPQKLTTHIEGIQSSRWVVFSIGKIDSQWQALSGPSTNMDEVKFIWLSWKLIRLHDNLWSNQCKRSLCPPVKTCKRQLLQLSNLIEWNEWVSLLHFL